MKIFSLFLLIGAAFATQSHTIEDFILSIRNPNDLYNLLDTLARDNGGNIPNEVKEVLVKHNIQYPRYSQPQAQVVPQTQYNQHQPQNQYNQHQPQNQYNQYQPQNQYDQYQPQNNHNQYNPQPDQPQHQHSQYQPKPQSPYENKYYFKGMEKLTREEMDALTQFLDSHLQEQAYSRDHYIPPKVTGDAHGIPCHRDSDCPFQQFCNDLEYELKEDLRKHNLESQFTLFKEALDISGKECSRRFSDVIVQNSTRLLPNIYNAFNDILDVMQRSKRYSGLEHWRNEFETKVLAKFDYHAAIEQPLATTRQGLLSGNQGLTTGGISPLYIALLLNRASGSNNDLAQTILTLSYLGSPAIGGGAPGGLDLLSSPFLLLALSGNNQLAGNDLITFIIISQFAGGPNPGGTAYSLPLFLLLARNNTNNILLPWILTGGLGTGGQACPPSYYGAPQTGLLGGNGLQTYLLYNSLLGNNNNDNSVILLLVATQGGLGCPGAGGIDPFQLILLQSALGNNTFGNLGNNSLVTFLLLSGLGSGGTGGLDSNLLLLTLFNNQLNITDLIRILFISDPNFANNPLAFLVLFNNNLFGNGTLFSNNDNLLLILLFFSQGTAGVTGSQTIVTTPVAINPIDQSLPPPGGPLTQGGSYTTSVSTPGTSPSLFGGIFGQTGQRLGLWEFIIISNLLGNNNSNNNLVQTLLLIQLLQGGLFNQQPGIQPQPAQPNPFIFG